MACPRKGVFYFLFGKTMKKVLLTPEGRKELEKKLARWRKKKEALVKEMELARQEGDLKENAAYHQLRDTVSLLTQQIEELEARLKVAEVREKGNDGSVGLGAEVVVEIKGQRRSFRIVGDGESDPIRGRISYQSPWGQALIGRKKGERVTVRTPQGKINCRIVEIK